MTSPSLKSLLYQRSPNPACQKYQFLGLLSKASLQESQVCTNSKRWGQ